jgi:hypothetical protein
MAGGRLLKTGVHGLTSKPSISILFEIMRVLWIDEGVLELSEPAGKIEWERK